MNVLKTVELDLDKREEPIDFFYDDGQAYLFTMETSKKDKINIKRIYEFNIKSLKKGKKLGEASTYYDGKSAISFNFRDYFSKTVISESKDWIAQVTENKTKRSKNISLGLFLAQRDEEVTTNSNNVTLPFTDKEFEILDLMVDDFGYITVLGLELENNESKQLVAFTYMRNLKDVVRTDMNLGEGEYFVGDAAIKVKDKKIFVGGFYNEKNQNWAKGVVLYELNSKRKIIQTSKKDIKRSDFLRTGKEGEEKALKKGRKTK